MGSEGNDFSLIEANVMFRLERVFSDCSFVNSIMIDINDVFFETGLNGSTCLSNVGYPHKQRIW